MKENMAFTIKEGKGGKDNLGSEHMIAHCSVNHQRAVQATVISLSLSLILLLCLSPAILQGSTFMFSSVGKEEYGKLFDFVTAKQLRVKNRADQGGPNYQIDDDGGSDGDDDENDAYMERMKAEGRNRDSDMSSDDEEYDPDKDAHFDEDVKEE